MRVVISLGGSVFVTEAGIDVSYLKSFASLLAELRRKHKLAVVVGGGRIAKSYIEAAKQLGPSEFSLDLLGIDLTRPNARLVVMALGENAHPEPLHDFEEAFRVLEAGKVAVMGGTHPGHSTDAVAALLAEYLAAELLINATDVKGVYDKDPKSYPDAKLYEELSISELIEMLGEQRIAAGTYKLMDILAAKIVQRSRLNCIFLDGRDLGNLRRAIEGKGFVGTRITF